MLRFWKGKYFVKIYADGQGAGIDSAILAIGRATADAIRDAGAGPALGSAIPDKSLGLVDGSVHYFRSHVLLNQRFFVAHDNVLHLDRRTEAVLARYIRNQQDVTLVLVRYLGEKESSEAYESFVKAFPPDRLKAEPATTAGEKRIWARQKGDVVIVLFGPSTPADADLLFNAVKGVPRERD